MVRTFIILILIVLPFSGSGQVKLVNEERISQKDNQYITEFEYKVINRKYDTHFMVQDVDMGEHISFHNGTLTFNERIDTIADFRIGCIPDFRESLINDSGFYAFRCETVLDTCTYCNIIVGFDTTELSEYQFYSRHDTVFFKEVISGFEYPMLNLNDSTFKAYCFRPRHKLKLDWFQREKDSMVIKGDDTISVYKLISYYEGKYSKIDMAGAVIGEKAIEVLVSKETLVPVSVTYYWYTHSGIKSKSYILTPKYARQ